MIDFKVLNRNILTIVRNQSLDLFGFGIQVEVSEEDFEAVASTYRGKSHSDTSLCMEQQNTLAWSSRRQREVKFSQEGGSAPDFSVLSKDILRVLQQQELFPNSFLLSHHAPPDVFAAITAVYPNQYPYREAFFITGKTNGTRWGVEVFWHLMIEDSIPPELLKIRSEDHTREVRFRNVVMKVMFSRLADLGFETVNWGYPYIVCFGRESFGDLKEYIVLTDEPGWHQAHLGFRVGLYRNKAPHPVAWPFKEGHLAGPLEFLLHYKYGLPARAPTIWRYATSDELEKQLEDLIVKITTYAVPWLEDPLSTNADLYPVPWF